LRRDLARNRQGAVIVACCQREGMDALRYPLSLTQEWFLSMDKGDDSGPFGSRYLIVSVLRITGQVDLAALQGALDDVVTRHELLRTVVVRDADPPYQVLSPPCQVPLEVRDLPSATRDLVMQKLLVEAEGGTLSTRVAPMMRALLCRFDDRDSALFLTVHHSVSDGWSVGIVLRVLRGQGQRHRAEAAGNAPVPRVRRVAAGQRRQHRRRRPELLGGQARRSPRIRHAN
jgi:hypothetical protein